MQKSNFRNNLMRDMIAPQKVGLENNPKAKLLPIERIVSNPFQVRQDFSSPEALAALEELAADIQQHGILQPLLVRPLPTPAVGNSKTNTSALDVAAKVEKFEIVAGERRYRAAQLADLKELPVIIETYTDEEARLVSLTENLQRRDLNFKEEVTFLAELDAQRSTAGKGGESDLAQLIHKSRTYVAKRLKLVAFPELVERVSKSELSINEAYTQAVSHDKTTSEKDNEVFLGNTSKRDPHQKTPSSTSTLVGSSSFAARAIPFTRLREAVVKLNRELERLDSEERVWLKQELDQLEQELTQLRSKLQ